MKGLIYERMVLQDLQHNFAASFIFHATTTSSRVITGCLGSYLRCPDRRPASKHSMASAVAVPMAAAHLAAMGSAF